MRPGADRELEFWDDNERPDNAPGRGDALESEVCEELHEGGESGTGADENVGELGANISKEPLSSNWVSICRAVGFRLTTDSGN